MSHQLEINHLRDAIDKGNPAIRLKIDLEPLAPKVFPPTFEGGKYATEERIINGNRIPCVLIDSVASQANRMEEGLQEAWMDGKIRLPVISSDFSKLDNPGIVKITSLQAPHRIADAILRDSVLVENGKEIPFRKSVVGKQIDQLTLMNATPLLRHAPHSLVFGLWDSTGPRGGAGAKFARAIVSEIVGINVAEGVKTSSRIDPLGIKKNSGVLYKTEDGGWTLDEKLALKDKGKPVRLGSKIENGKVKTEGDGKPSEANHGNVTPSVTDGGFTIDHAEQTTVLSLAALRRLRFPESVSMSATNEENLRARTYLASLGLLAATIAIDTGYDLRSRCLLRATDSIRWTIIGKPGENDTTWELSMAGALELYNSALEGVRDRLDLNELVLTPKAELLELVKKSLELASVEGDIAE